MRSLCVTWGSAGKATAGFKLLGLVGRGCWVCCPHWAFPASSQGDSGFPTELAAACHPGPRPGNTARFLHHLFLTPGYHPEEQRYGPHLSPGALAGRGQEGLLGHWAASLCQAGGQPVLEGPPPPLEAQPGSSPHRTLPCGRPTVASCPTEVIKQEHTSLYICRAVPHKNLTRPPRSSGGFW